MRVVMILIVLTRLHAQGTIEQGRQDIRNGRHTASAQIAATGFADASSAALIDRIAKGIQLSPGFNPLRFGTNAQARFAAYKKDDFLSSPDNIKAVQTSITNMVGDMEYVRTAMK